MRGDEEMLLEVFERLPPAQQETLIAFAEFLAVRPSDGANPAAGPVAFPRPAEETVTMAIRRLTRTYPMLERRRLITDASRFIVQHALENRPDREVIDELERVFAGHYERTRAEGGRQKAEG